jgi:signal transduction histidine kinase
MAESEKTLEQQIADMRLNLTILRSSTQTGRIDVAFLARQIEKLNHLIDHFEAQSKHFKQEERFASLYNLSRSIGSSLDLQVVLDQAMDAIIELTGAERGFLMLRDDDGQLEVKAARNLDQQTLTSDQFKYSRSVVSQVLDSGESIMTTNAAEDPRLRSLASVVAQNLRSIFAVPLRVRGKVLGVIYVDTRAMGRFLDDNALEALETLAGQAAIAIDNARLFSTTDNQLRERVEELQQLRRIDLQLNETLDAAKAAQIALNWAGRLSQAAMGHLGLLEDGRLISAYHYGVDTDESEPIFLEELFPEALTVFSTGDVYLYDGESSTLIIPIKREANVIGVVVLWRQGKFSSEQQEIVIRVIARAATAIENARLYTAVRAADRAKSEFVGIVAHDLKVPMTSILGYADLTLLDNNLANHQMSYLQRIRETVRRMEMLVSDLADISRIESGMFLMAESRVPVAKVVQGLRDAIQTQMATRSHTWIEAIEPDLPALRTDYYRLLQVLTNLTSNAYKYTPDGGAITLTIQHDPTQPNERIQFSVSDTGIGLSADAIQKLGTKFWRAEDEYTRSQPGTGLGFSITRSLVEQMGSQILIESEIGHGSIFTFSVATYQEE